jgi:hypothetical protein
MTMRLLLVAMVAAGVTFAPAAFAEEAMKPVMAKSKTHKPAKAHKKPVSASRPSARMKKNDDMMGEPYSAQKDDMTR